MNLLITIFFLTCVLVVTAQPMTEDQKNALLAQVVAECKAQEGASDEDVKDAMEHKPPRTRPAQCFHACLMETFGVMKDGKLSAEGGIKIAEMSGDPAKVKNSEAVGKECQSVGSGDRCDNVLDIMQCVAKVAAQLGFDPATDLH